MRLLAVNDGDSATLSSWLPVNRALYSADPSNAVWVRTGLGGVTMNAITWSNGTQAHKIYEDATTNSHMLRQTVNLDAGLNTVSMFASPGERTFFRLWVYNNTTGASATATFDLVAGTCVMSSSGSDITAVSVVMLRAGPSDAWRCVFTVSAAAAASYFIRTHLMTTSAIFTYTGVAGNGLYVTQAQVEPSPVATTYMATAAAAVTASDFAAALPLSNLQREGRAKVARTVGLTGTQGIQIAWGSATPINAVVLHGHNLTSSAYVRLLCYDGADGTGNILYDSGNLKEDDSLWASYRWPGIADGRKFSVLWLPTLVSARSARLLVRDPGNSAGYWEASRLLVGQYVEPTRQMSVGMEIGWAEDTEQRRTEAGSLRSDPKTRYRTLSGSIDGLSESERGDLYEALGYAGKSREVFVSVFPGAGGDLERDHSLLAKQTRTPVYKRSQSLYSSASLSFAEA